MRAASAERRRCRICDAYLARDNLTDVCSCHDAGESRAPVCEWVDGPRFCEWLDVMRPDHDATARAKAGITEPLRSVEDREKHPGSDARRLHDARHAERPLSVWVADRILTRLGLYLGDVPDACWIEERRRAPRITDPEAREQILERIAAGERSSAVALEFGIHPDTIRKWRRAVAA